MALPITPDAPSKRLPRIGLVDFEGAAAGADLRHLLPPGNHVRLLAVRIELRAALPFLVDADQAAIREIEGERINEAAGFLEGSCDDRLCGGEQGLDDVHRD